jgi:hypothetical protein
MCLSLSFAQSLLLLSKDLLETVCGWLWEADILALRTTCSRLTRLRGCCPVLFAVPAVLGSVRTDLVETLHAVANDTLDLRDLRALKTLHLDLVGLQPKIHVPCGFGPQIVLRLLEPGRVINTDLPLFGSLLTHVEWHFCRTSEYNVLSRLFALPRLASLVLHRANDVADTEASEDCPLARIEFVDCWHLDLHFLERLTRLKSLRFRDVTTGGGLRPEDVPGAVRPRVERLDVERQSLFVRGGLYTGISLDGFSGLRALSLVSEERNHGLALDVCSRSGLESLRLVSVCSPCFGPLPNLVSLDLEFLEFHPATSGFHCLQTLVLRELTGSGNKFVAERLGLLRTLPRLCSLKLTCMSHWGQSPVPTEGLPPLDTLELESLRPTSVPDVRTLRIQAESFALLSRDSQQALKSIKNLFVYV